MSKRYYMGGVCGMGMAPLAAFIADEGNDIDALDDSPNSELKDKLETRGIKFRPPNGFYDKVVISTALSRRAQEFSAFCAPENIVRRGVCWAEICAARKLTAVVGSHGKSTVSGLLAHAIQKLGLDSGYLVGAIPNGFSMHRHCACGKPIVSEIDESDATIEYFSPEVCVALNADLDHTDTYADNQKLEEMFERLFARTKKLVLYPQNDEILKRVAGKSQTPSLAVKTRGDYFQINEAMAFAALKATFPQGNFEPHVFSDFAGLQRRCEKIFDNGEITVVSDYAHHPNEVKSFLHRFLAKSEGQKIVFFQPHRFSRTRRFAQDFADILSQAANDSAQIYILPVYAASELRDPLGESSEILKRCSNSAQIKLANADDFSRIATSAIKEAKRAQIAFVGAGDFHFAVKKFFSKIK